MKISHLAKTLCTVLVLPVCGTAITAGAVRLETALNRQETQEPQEAAFPQETQSPESVSPAIIAPSTQLGIPQDGSLLPNQGMPGQPTPGADAFQQDAFLAPSQFAEEEEVVKVDDAVAGWNGAAVDAELNLGTELRSSWVVLDAEGNLPGQILSDAHGVAEAKIFLIQEGRLKAEVETNAEGRFTVRGISQGSYSVLVHAGDYYAISGLIVLDNEYRSANFQHRLTISVSEASTVAIYNLVTQRATNVTFRNFGEHAFGETPDDPARLYGFQGLTSQKPEAVPATTIRSSRVQLTDEGSFIGRLHAVRSLNARPVDLKTTDVILLKDGEVVQNTKTNRYGIFRMENLEPGYYSLVSAGPDGVLVSGIELTSSELPQPKVASNEQDAPYRTSLRQEEETETIIETEEVELEQLSSFDGMLAPREDIGWINNYMLENRVYDQSTVEDVIDPYGGVPMMGGCGCGGGYGAYGGGGGGGGCFGGLGLGGGLGSSLALPLTAAAIAAVAASDDGNPYRAPTPISAFQQ